MTAPSETGLHLPLATFATAEGPDVRVPHYPKAEYTNAEILADRNLFEMELHKLAGALRFARAGLKVAGREVDLHRLYTEVVTRGGLESVIKNQLWVEVCLPFNFPDTFTDKSFKIRNLYSQNLHHFEQVFFWRNEGPVVHPPKRKERAPNTHGAFGKLAKGLTPKHKFKPQFVQPHRFPPPHGLEQLPRYLPHVSMDHRLPPMPQLALDQAHLLPHMPHVHMAEQALPAGLTVSTAVLNPEHRALHHVPGHPPHPEQRTMQVLPAAEQVLQPGAVPLVLERITQARQQPRPEPQPAPQSGLQPNPEQASKAAVQAPSAEPRPAQPPALNQDQTLLKLPAPATSAGVPDQPRAKPAASQEQGVPPSARPRQPQSASQVSVASLRSRPASQLAAATATADSEHRAKPSDMPLALAPPMPSPGPPMGVPAAHPNMHPHMMAGPHGYPPHSHPYAPDGEEYEWDDMECMPGAAAGGAAGGAGAGGAHAARMRHHYYYAPQPMPYMPHPAYGDMHYMQAHMMGAHMMHHPDMCAPPMDYPDYPDAYPPRMPMPMYGMMHPGGMPAQYASRHMYMPYPPGAARVMPPSMRRRPSPQPAGARSSSPAQQLPQDMLPPGTWPAMYRHGDDEDEDDEMEGGYDGEEEQGAQADQAAARGEEEEEDAELDAARGLSSKDPSAGGSTCTLVRPDGRPAPASDQWNNSKRPRQQRSVPGSVAPVVAPRVAPGASWGGTDVEHPRDVYVQRPPGPRPAYAKMYPPGAAMRQMGMMGPGYPMPYHPAPAWGGWRPGWDDTAE